MNHLRFLITAAIVCGFLGFVLSALAEKPKLMIVCGIVVVLGLLVVAFYGGGDGRAA